MIRRLWHHHRMALLAFVLVTVLALFFAIRATMQIIYWNDPRHQNQPLENWMTLGYIARSYSLPRDELAAALNFSRDREGGKSLKSIAAQRGISTAALIEQIEAAIEKVRAGVPQ